MNIPPETFQKLLSLRCVNCLSCVFFSPIGMGSYECLANRSKLICNPGFHFCAEFVPRVECWNLSADLPGEEAR